MFSKNHYRASDAHQMILEIRYRHGKDNWNEVSPTQQSSQNVTQEPTPSLQFTRGKNIEWTCEINFHGATWGTLWPELASHPFLWSPNLLLIILCQRESGSNGNLHKHLEALYVIFKNGHNVLNWKVKILGLLKCWFSSFKNCNLVTDDWMQIVEGISNATAVQLDVTDYQNLCKYISKVESFALHVSNSKSFMSWLIYFVFSTCISVMLLYFLSLFMLVNALHPSWAFSSPLVYTLIFLSYTHIQCVCNF